MNDKNKTQISHILAKNNRNTFDETSFSLYITSEKCRFQAMKTDFQVMKINFGMISGLLYLYIAPDYSAFASKI